MPPFNRSVAEKASRGVKILAHVLWTWIKGPGRQIAAVLALQSLHWLRINLTPRRLLSFPHLVALFWVVILLWGERWVFDSNVQSCDWENWETWPKGATPHHLVLLADPQIVDPHTYPGRPWPLTSLTVAVSDNYLGRGYKALQTHLHPDSVFFLGDLFDGGREWKTRAGHFADPKWGLERPGGEKKHLRSWHRKYGDDYWLREFRRFGNIFFGNFNVGGEGPGAWQRGRKLVASLPGNHDLGFGAMVQLPVRNRFNAFFGESNRVDIVGNHTIVSVDTVSLSAATSEYRSQHEDDLEPIYGPVLEFLDGVQLRKSKLAREELNVWYGLEGKDSKLKHSVEDFEYDPDAFSPQKEKKGSSEKPAASPAGTVDFPTILLTHVPLYRMPGTPCGPKREHWPPTKPPKGQTKAVDPDERNAILVEAGYQYQNVLGEEDSVRLIKSVGNVVHVFSGDDHDYCEVVHSPAKQNVREITVKSMSMLMGVSNPGFLMVSLYNPLDREGKPLPGNPEQTLQTHLCILPNQLHTYMRYITLGILSLGVLAVRALLVPVLRLTPFHLDRESGGTAPFLPLYKDKKDDSPTSSPSGFASSASSRSRVGSRRSLSSTTHTTGGNPSNGGAHRWESKKVKKTPRPLGGRWGHWNDDYDDDDDDNNKKRRGPRIKIKLDDVFYDGAKEWKGSRDGRDGGRFFALGDAGREMWATSWRVVWVSVLFWAYLTREGW